MVWHPIRAALEAGLDPVVVVTGGAGAGAHEAAAEWTGDGATPGRSLSPDPGPRGPGQVRLATNPDPRRGLASSLEVGVHALPGHAPAVVVLLGDMPWVRAETIGALVTAFRRWPASVCVPVYDGRRGNPVLWPSAYFEALSGLRGDRGARSLLDDPDTPVRPVPVDDRGIHRDVDTQEELEALNGPV